MTLGGIGPKLALLNLPYVILSLVVMKHDPEFLNMDALDCVWIRLLGFIWLAAGVLFWVFSAWIFLHDFKAGKLIKRGPFACCRNPIYASMILFIIPALGIIFHSGLILSIALVLYMGFKIAIHGETILLRKTFGSEYDEYEKSVNELFPIPWNLSKRK